jgi:hypothetical protein
MDNKNSDVNQTNDDLISTRRELLDKLAKLGMLTTTTASLAILSGKVKAASLSAFLM